MKCLLTDSRAVLTAIGLVLLLAMSSLVEAAVPDLTATGVIATIDKSLSYNLGPTGLRGWIYNSGDGSLFSPQEGYISALSRQILVTVVGTATPASGVLAADDVILGVGWGTGSDPVPLFTSDARKSFGWAIGEAEKFANSGILKLKRWRAGVTTDVAITLPVMGSYTDTAPFNCPKSALILANAINVLKNASFENNFGGPISALALLASVVPGDPDYAAVQSKLQIYARSLAPGSLSLTGCSPWDWGYINLFLCEYYLRGVTDGNPDASVLHGINEYTVALAKGQGMFGTYGHGGSILKPDGSLHGSVPWYGPVNAAGIPANIAIVMGKKALLAGGIALDPEIDPAIDRGSKYFSYFVNKGSIPYGEHEPWTGHHASNGKDAMCAVFFGLQDDRSVEAEYFTRMTVAGFNGREYGHTGQGFSYLWGPLGANIGGPEAVAAYLKQVRWHLDLERRTDGSFVYDGGEQYGAGSTSDGTYLGKSAYYDLSPTATYILTNALPLQRLLITGRNAIPANTIDSTKVANAIAAATYRLDCTTYLTSQLMAALAEYDPSVRSNAANELASRALSPTEISALITMAEAANVNQRLGACETLGLLKNTSALDALGRRLSDPVPWVRAKAANAFRYFGATANPQLTPMLTAMAANARPIEPIDWTDPLQFPNGFLADALFNSGLADSSINAIKSLLYPAMKAGLQQPAGMWRNNLSGFMGRLSLADVEALAPDLCESIRTGAPADTMFSTYPRNAAINVLAKYSITEGMDMGLILAPTWSGALNALASYGDAARWTLPTLEGFLMSWNPGSSDYTTLVNAVATIENATTAPILVPGLPVATSQVVTTEADKVITLTGYDSAGDPLTYAIVTQPAHGTLTGTPPNVTYTPVPNYYGIDRFTFKTSDGSNDSAQGTVSLIVGVAGTGLKGEYFNNADFSSLKLTRTDASLNFDWSFGPPNALLAPDSFSVRWTGQLLAPESCSYRFSTLNSDGVRLWINGVMVLDDYTDQAIRWNDGISIDLTAGHKYDMIMEYYDNTGNAAAKLKWSGPSFAGNNGVIISKEWLYDGSTITNRAPVALAKNVTLAEDTATAIILGGGDPFFDTLTYTIATQPAHGTLTGTPPNLTYTPANNYNGTDSFSFTVNDGTLTSAAATVGLTITPVNDAILVNASADYAGYAATTATLNAKLTCDEASYAVYACWGTTNGGNNATQWQHSALAASRSNATASTISFPVAGLVANTRYYFTFRAVSEAGELWGDNVQDFGPNSSNDILAFGLPDQPASISGTAIEWPVLSSSLVTNLAPVFTLSPGATCNKSSGANQNFSSPVTYTVTAQDGAAKVYTVTATRLPNASFFWNSTTTGYWSAANKWLNESGMAAAPAPAGQTYDSLNFTNTGTYTAINDLSAGFQLNRINFNGPTVTLTGNGLAFTSWNSPNGLIPPQVNQYGSSAVTISTPLSMSSDLTFGGPGSGQITLTGLVGSGNLTDGTLTQAGANILFLNNANNGYPGGLVVSNSTLKATVGPNKAFGGPSGSTWQGTRMKMNNATLLLVGGGWCMAGFDLSGTNTIRQTDLAAPFFLGGITGSGLLNLTGNHTLEFGGDSSTYGGDVRINQGLSAQVKCGGTNVFGSGGTVTMASPGGVNMSIENSNGASLDNYIYLETPLVLGWSYNTMTFNFKRDISGPGSITKTYDTADAGTHLQLRGLNSTYSGGTIFKSGNLEVLGAGSLGTGTLTLGGKAASVSSHVMAFVNLAPMTLPNHIILAGINEASLSDLAALTTFTVNQDLVLAGNVSGTGGLLKTGSKTLTLSGLNTCSGPVKVQAGILACSRAASLGQGSLDITDGAKLQLDYQGTRQIAALSLNGGTPLANGTYGSTASLASIKDDSHFTGTGMVTIGPVAAATTITTLALTAGSNPSASGTALTFTATVAGNAPSGTLSFYCGGAVIGTSILNGSCQASITTTSLSQGWQYITAFYQGDTNNLLGSSEAFEQFIGEPLPNAVPVATAQSVSTAEDTAKAITLAATDTDGDALGYSIVTLPAHGTLTGTEPNITYTPAANYSGSDSFAFKANDGHVDSKAAMVSITVTAVSDAPVAFAQSVSVGINSAKAITLQATDADGGSLTYTIVSQPTHGALSGTAPNMTYTPATNYSGTDSFTFTASDGSNTSAVVTVSIVVTSSVFTWNSAVSGNWSDSTKWATGSGKPGIAGQTDYVLDFSKSGTYTASHDLSTGYLLNQLNFAGAVTLAGTNSLVLTANGATPPRIYQNSASGVTLSMPLNLAADLTIGGSGSGQMELAAVISGAGGLTKEGAGTLKIDGLTPNTYSGATIINHGKLHLGTMVSGSSPSCTGTMGTGPVTLNSGGIIEFDRVTATNALILNGGTIISPNGWGASWSGPVTLNSNTTVQADSGMSFSGDISGAGGFIKTGGGTLSLSGANRFSGAVAVQAGTLKAASLNRVSGGSATGSLGAPATVAAGTISLGSGTSAATLQYYGSGETTDRMINLAGTTGGAVLDQSGSGGLLVFTSALAVSGTGAKTLTLQGSTGGKGEFAGAIVNSSSGATAVTKTGTGTWTLSGVNSYSSATKVTAGTLVCSIASSLGSGSLDISSGAKLQLNYVGTRQVAALSFNAGSAQANGTYGSSSSPATFKNDSYFAGFGTVTVGPVTGTSSTALALTGGGSPSDFGESLTFSATVAGSAPTGNVAFYADGIPLGSATLNSIFQASVTTSNLTFGSHRITAQYAGDANQSPSTSASLAILINTPVNDAPVASGQSVSTAEDTPVPITLAASDANGDALTYAIVTSPAHGTLSGSPPNMIYTPSSHYHGIDNFTFVARDRYANSAAAIVSLTVTSVNNAPVVVAQTVSTAAKTTKAITLAASDVDGDALSYVIVTQPAHGTLGGTAPNVTYTPATNYIGTDSFTFKANDGTVDSTAAAVSVIVFQPPSGLPVVDGLAVWLKAESVNTANTSQVRIVGSNMYVKQWIDQSGGGHHATQTTDAKQPIYIASGVNGKPVLRFVESSDNKLYLGDLSASFPTAGSMFAVSTINTDGRYSLFDNRNNDSRWVANTWNESQPGVFRGSRAGMTYASWPQSGSHVFAMESTSSIYRFVIDGTQIGSAGGDYHNGSGQNWTIGDRPGDGQQLNGDIPEFILYNRVLSSNEANAVGRYLADKYGLSTTYVATPPQAGIVSFGIPGNAAVINENAKTIAWTVPYGTSMATLAPTFALSVGATCNQANSSVPTPNFSGGPLHYVVTAADPLVTSDYTVTVSETPIGTAKDMLTFGLPGLPAEIDGTNIVWVVPHGTDMATLAPAYTVSPYASGSPASSAAPNFASTNPATYTLTAQDGSTQIYHVAVSVMPESPVTVNLAYMNTMDGTKTWEQKGSAGQAAPLAYTGTTWNNGGNGSAAVSNLKNSDGTASGISVSAVLRPRASSVAWGSILGGNKLASYPAGLGLGSVFAGDSGIMSGFVDVLTFSGLASNHSYNMVLVDPTGWSATFQYQSQSATVNMQAATDWVNGNNYALLTNCIPNASGQITIQETITHDWSALCGFQIVDNGVMPLATQPFASWITGYYASPGNLAPDVDPDGDGLSNSIEYVLGTRPDKSNTGGPGVSTIGGNYIFTFQRALASNNSSTSVAI
ncbi:MAG: DUF6288 domain-containing protein [Verrucomicrobiota bacterium]